ncbi:MAG: hypothetical protein LBC39_05060 [Methanobrevibacter sp.]|jgi:hypothetical protein|nr:hypothetical protein [Candidatus Methanovirga aequatorialis]
MIRNKRFFNKARRFLIRKDINVLHWNADQLFGKVGSKWFYYFNKNKLSFSFIISIFLNSYSNVTNTRINRGGRIFKFLSYFSFHSMFINHKPFLYTRIGGGYVAHVEKHDFFSFFSTIINL